MRMRHAASCLPARARGPGSRIRRQAHRQPRKARQLEVQCHDTKWISESGSHVILTLHRIAHGRVQLRPVLLLRTDGGDAEEPRLAHGGGSSSGSRNPVSSRPDSVRQITPAGQGKQVWRTYVLPGSALRLQRCKTRPWETSLPNALFKCPSVAPGHYSNAYATASGPAPRHHKAHVAPTSRPAAKTTNSTRAFRRDLSNCISASATRSEQLTPKPVSGPEPPAGDCTQSPRTRTHFSNCY